MFFKIESIYDVIAILSFICSTYFVIYRIYFQGKPKLTCKAGYSTIYQNNIPGDTQISFTITNTGIGNIYLRNCGFYTNAKNKKKVIVLPQGYTLIPLGSNFPYVLEERKRIEILYPKESFKKIYDDNKILYFFISDETGKDWKFNIRKFGKKVMNYVQNEK